jgi:hypothetical protein
MRTVGRSTLPRPLSEVKVGRCFMIAVAIVDVYLVNA